MLRIFLIILVWCFAGSAIAREIPMWEGIKKNPAMIAADEEFIAAIEKAGGRRAGANRANQLGWDFLGQHNPDMAIKRFNQAWLLDPSNPNIYWGYAVAVHQQGRPISEVKRFFTKAERGFASNRAAMVDLYSDEGQVFGERRMYRESIKAFEKALKLNPNHKKSRRGIVISANAIGDTATAKKYR